MEIDEKMAKGEGFKQYYITKIEELQLIVAEKSQNLRRLQAQRNELNAKGKKSKHKYSHFKTVFAFHSHIFFDQNISLKNKQRKVNKQVFCLLSFLCLFLRH